MYQDLLEFKFNYVNIEHLSLKIYYVSCIYVCDNEYYISYKTFCMSCLKTLKSLFCQKKKPEIKENTFIVWEPCSSSHAEIVPGFAKYLLELGFHVSILVTPERYDEGLFCRFENENISYNVMTQKQIRKFFLNNEISNVKGILVTTLGKLSTQDIESAYKSFHPNVDKSKIFFVEHEIDKLVDNGKLKESIITLREIDYKGAKTTVVNPHYFGVIKSNLKNETTNFVTIGELSEKRKNTKILVDAVSDMVTKGFTNFKVTVIGKGKLSSLPQSLRQYFDIKGRLNFDEMYDQIEKADFILSAYENTDIHRKYITVKTSGTFQLVYGFLKPIIIRTEFAEINGFDDQNSLIYSDDSEYSLEMIRAIEMTQENYRNMQNKLDEYASQLFLSSKDNLQKLIAKK